MDKFVEKVTLHESQLKINVENYTKEINDIKENMEILTVNKQMVCVEYATSYGIETKKLIEEYKINFNKHKELKTKKKSELKELKLELMREKEKRKGDEFGIEHLLYEILEKSNIKKNTFMG